MLLLSTVYVPSMLSRDKMELPSLELLFRFSGSSLNDLMLFHRLSIISILVSDISAAPRKRTPSFELSASIASLLFLYKISYRCCTVRGFAKACEM